MMETRARSEKIAAEAEAAWPKYNALIVHASSCQSRKCSQNCAKTKALFQHGLDCKMKCLGGCVSCTRLWAMLQRHAMSCSVSDCAVPRCVKMRELKRQRDAGVDESIILENALAEKRAEKDAKMNKSARKICVE